MTRRVVARRVRLKADALWECLQRRHLTSGEFAQRAGISAGYLSQLVIGQRSPSPRTTRLLLDALDVEFDALFYFEETSDQRR